MDVKVPRELPPRRGELPEDILEALRILQEEAAEVIHAASKICRAGPDYVLNNPDNTTTKQQFIQELGDVKALMDELVSRGFISQYDIDEAAARKRVKLYSWSRYLGSLSAYTDWRVNAGGGHRR